MPQNLKQEDMNAIMKRLAVCKLSAEKPLICEVAVKVYSQKNVDDAKAMLDRLARLNML